MKHIFLDFDRTLFDTERFYNSLELTYIEGIIAGQLGADFSRFIYPDVLSFIWNVQQAGFTCHLVTFGRRQVQECKFRLSGLASHFDQMFYVEQGSKADVIKKYLDSCVSCEKVVFIDDTIEHLEAFATQFPNSTVLRMARPGAKGSEVVDDRFCTVSSCLDILKIVSVNEV
jgi:methionine salvage enolase-phosphatase E1